MIEIPVSKGKYTALIDDEDFALVSQYKWRAYKGGNPGERGTVYAIAHTPMVSGKRSNVIMHRLIMNAPKGVLVDHRDFYGLNNQKYNLRLANDEQNSQHQRKVSGSSSSFKGVSLDKRHGTWKCYINIATKLVWIGQFKTEIEAAMAYDEAVVKHHGEFAVLNLPLKTEG